MCECHCSRIQAWLRLHGRSVSITINDLHPFGLREDEVNHSIFSLPVWFSMATYNGLAVCAMSSCLLMARKAPHHSTLQNR